MKPRLRFAALLGAVLLASCNLAPPYQSPAKTLGILPVSFKEGGRWQPATPASTLQRGPWWRIYHDASLDSLESQLIAANPDLAAAVANYSSYKDAALQLDAYLFPFVSASGEAGRFQVSTKRPLRHIGQPNYSNFHTMGGELRYEVDIWDQLHNATAAGIALAQAAAADLASVQLSLEADLANAYLTLRELDNDVDLLQQTVTAYQHYLQIVEQRHVDNIASGLDVSQARFQVDAASAQESGLRAQRAVYEHMIADLIGKPASAFSIAPKVTHIAVPVIPTGVPSQLLQRRPDIAAAERRVAAANAEIGVARAAFYPNLMLNATGNFNSSLNAPPLVTLPVSFWSLGASSLAPLYEGGFLRAQLAQKVALWHQATENYRSVALNAFQQVEDALSNLNLLSEQYGHQQAAVKDALRVQQLGFDLYQLGAKNYLEVIVDQELALQAEMLLIDDRESVLLASVSLVRALGGGWTTDRLPGRDAVLTLSGMDPRKPLPPAPQP